MKPLDRLAALTLNQKLAALFFVLAVIALFAGDPYTGTKTTIDAQEMALMVEKQVDHVSAEELADWIIQARADYRLVDLRTENEFNAYHIPGAENIPLAQLMTADLQRNEKLVLYSAGGIHSAQAWLLLQARGYKSVYMLFGGLDEWKEKILFPQIPADATAEQIKQYEKSKEVCKYFGGTPQSGAVETTVAKPDMPTLSLPSGSGGAARPAGKKKKEGC